MRLTTALRKRALEAVLEGVPPHPRPKLLLEQYTIPSRLAAELLFIAGVMHADIQGRSVADLGTGTGRLAIGAALLGAERVIGIDVDEDAIKLAAKGARDLGVEVEWVVGDIKAIRGPVDTVVMNPPFGTKIRHSDRAFLDHALEIAKVLYTIHKSSTRSYVVDYVKRRGGKVEALFTATLEIPHMFRFHIRRVHKVQVDILRIANLKFL